MAHTYIIQSVTHMGDIATITGSVDGIPVTVTGWWSAITSAANVLAAQAYMTGLMLAAAFPPSPTGTAVYNGTITQ